MFGWHTHEVIFLFSFFLYFLRDTSLTRRISHGCVTHKIMFGWHIRSYCLLQLLLSQLQQSCETHLSVCVWHVWSYARVTHTRLFFFFFLSIFLARHINHETQQSVCVWHVWIYVRVTHTRVCFYFFSFCISCETHQSRDTTVSVCVTHMKLCPGDTHEFIFPFSSFMFFLRKKTITGHNCQCVCDKYEFMFVWHVLQLQLVQLQHLQLRLFVCHCMQLSVYRQLLWRSHCKILQHDCNTLLHTPTCCNILLQQTATCCTTLQHAATYCTTLQLYTINSLQNRNAGR